jgi:hypothetical protein
MLGLIGILKRRDDKIQQNTRGKKKKDDVSFCQATALQKTWIFSHHLEINPFYRVYT